MIKIYFSICLSLIFGIAVYAQQMPKAKNRTATFNYERKGNNINNPMQVAGSIVCHTGYVAGTTMNLNFTLSTTNTDEEYIDSLAIIFPAGFTILSTSANPEFPTADSTGGPEHFNGISGQIISWGSNVNNTDSFGGIWANPPQMFSIKVAIAPGVTGNQTATFFAHGDEYPRTLGDSTSGNLSGTITLSPPAPNDLGAVSATVSNGCAATTTTTVSFKFWNIGTLPQSNFSLGYIVNGGAAVTETYTPVVNPNDTATYNFITPLVMVADTIYNIKVYTALSGDSDVNTDTTLATSYTSHNVPYSTGFEPSPQSDLLGWKAQHVSGSTNEWVINSYDPHAGSHSAYLFSAVNGTSDDWLFSPCINLTAGPTYQLTFYSMKYGDSTRSGQLHVWLGSGASPVNMDTTLLNMDSVKAGTSSPAYGKDSVLFTVSVNGTYVFGFEGKNIDATKKTALLLDDISITNLGYAGIKKYTNKGNNLNVWPNPTAGILNFSYPDLKGTVELIVTDILGKVVIQNAVFNLQTTNSISMESLKNGVYSLQIKQNGTLFTAKIIKID